TAVSAAFRPNPNTNNPEGDTLTIFPFSETFAPALVCPVTNPPWLKCPSSERGLANAAMEKAQNTTTQLNQ
ncbi:MAG: hypothetical protein VXY66_08845, partial [Pseudomonadota bacterium]|nr:hypothetical protein [Pseudomonadota bacterium]